MEGGDSSEKDERTEAPSDRRLQKATEEGQIAIGREAGAVAGFVGGTVALLALGRPLRDSLVRLVAASAEGVRAAAETDTRILVPLLYRPLFLIGLVCAIATAAGVAAFVAQTKGRFWSNLALPDFTRVWSGTRLGRLFGAETAIDLGLAMVKLLTVAWVCWSSLRDDFLTLPRLLFARPDVQFAMLFTPLAKGAVKVLTAMAFWAGVDLAVQRLRHRKRMKMTRDEVKREYKEEEGDPMIKGRRRRRHRELAKGRAAVEVPRADALIVNPTHIAIAIRYRPDEGSAPRVTAKGKGALAEHMRDLARANGVPIVENIALARLLYRRVKVGRSVPAETFKAVAAILAYVYRLTGRAPGARA